MVADAPRPAASAGVLDAEAFLRRISDRTARIAIIGMGYVGLPLALALASKDFPVIGFDVDPAKVDDLNAGRSYIGHIASDRVSAMRRKGLFEATTDEAALGAVDAILVCVPTPLTQHREPDMTYVVQTTEQIARHLRPGQLVVLESTTYPGTTAGVMRPRLEAGGLESGRDFFLAYSPEREDPGNIEFSTARIPKVVGGDGPEALRVAAALYEEIVPQVVRVASPDTAEAVKLTENIFRSVNIALVNELKLVYDAMGIDVWEVIEAAKTKPFGYMPFYPGPGLGGHCIPIDPFYLTWKAREFNHSTRFIELAGEINTAMPGFVVERLAQSLDRRLGKGLSRSEILILGLAYKKNVDDTRESASFKVIELLEGRGARVSYYDPHVPVIPETREHAPLAGRRSIEWSPEALARFDAAMILTDHDCVDYALLVEASGLVIDTRNAAASVPDPDGKVVKA